MILRIRIVFMVMTNKVILVAWKRLVQKQDFVDDWSEDDAGIQEGVHVTDTMLTATDILEDSMNKLKFTTLHLGKEVHP